MAKEFRISNPVSCRPLTEWSSISSLLLGTQTRYIQGARWRHRVIETGQGEPLFLIHGVGGHAETFARNMHNLGKHFHVYAIDALYHGYTDKVPAYEDRPEARHDHQVDALIDLMDALDIEKAHMEGESMGGQIVMEFGIRYPERSGKLIMNTGIGRVKLSKTDFIVPEADYSQLAKISTQAILEPDFEIMQKRLAWLVKSPEQMTDEMVEIRLTMYRDPEINLAMRKFFSVGQGKTDPWDLTPCFTEDDLKNFKPEGLIFWTEFNPGEGPDLGEYAANLMANCKFYNMPGAAHWPQWEQPELHDQVLIEFIKGGN